MRAFHSAAAPQFPHLAQKTYAAHRVWKGSTRAEVKFQPLGANRDQSRRAAVKIFHDARRFERQTARTRRDAFGRLHQQGVLGRMGLLVLHALLFDFLNHRTGQLDPSYEALADKAIISRRSVARALVKLRDAGVLSWVKRCRESMDNTRYVLEQESNAYGVSAPSCWKGYRAPPEAPPPDPDAWGASPALPPLAVLGVAAHQAGDPRQARFLLGSDPGDWIARAALRRMPPAGGGAA